MEKVHFAQQAKRVERALTTRMEPPPDSRCPRLVATERLDEMPGVLHDPRSVIITPFVSLHNIYGVRRKCSKGRRTGGGER